MRVRENEGEGRSLGSCNCFWVNYCVLILLCMIHLTGYNQGHCPRIIWPNSKGDVLNCFIGDKISSLVVRVGLDHYCQKLSPFLQKIIKNISFFLAVSNDFTIFNYWRNGRYLLSSN